MSWGGADPEKPHVRFTPDEAAVLTNLTRAAKAYLEAWMSDPTSVETSMCRRALFDAQRHVERVHELASRA